MRAQTWIVSVPASVDALWAYLADYHNDVVLCAEDASATLIEGEVGQVGATYAVAIPWEGLTARFEAQLTAAEPGRCLSWSSSTAGSFGSATYTLQPEGDSGATQLTLDMTLDLRGAFAPLEPFGWSLMSRMAERMLSRLSGLHLS